MTSSEGAEEEKAEEPEVVEVVDEELGEKEQIITGNCVKRPLFGL